MRQFNEEKNAEARLWDSDGGGGQGEQRERGSLSVYQMTREWTGLLAAFERVKNLGIRNMDRRDLNTYL